MVRLSVVTLAGLGCWGQSAGPAGSSFLDTTFDFYHEFFGNRAFTNPEAAANFRNRMANGVSLQPPLDAALIEFVRSRGIHLMVDPVNRLKRDLNEANLASLHSAISDLAARPGMNKVLWNPMPEWDQSGGSWVPDGRPSYIGLSRQQAYNRFRDYYQTNYPALLSYFRQPPSSRRYWLTSVTDHAPNAVYAYEMGADICLLERSIDELGDISTGVAFVRGAARQYNRQWGIDVSTFRTSNNLSTQFDDRENLLGGWSPSYIRRHYFIAYMSGAHIIKNEPTTYYKPFPQLDPFGRMNREFAEFALERHPDVGRTLVPTALLLDHYSGFDPKHWLYNQADSVWYQDIPYTAGDRMINNFFKLAYPNHWLHGLTPGAPFNDASGKADPRAFQAYLARGGDPRPFEPMGTTRYGHSIDILTDRVPAATLSSFKVILLLGDVPIDARLRDALIAWVRDGGTLVLTVSQRAAFDDAFLGVHIDAGSRRATASTWLPANATTTERPYNHSPIALLTASPIALAADSSPLITQNPFGAGRVIVSGAPYLQTTAQDQLLDAGVRLFDWLAAQHSAVALSGPPVEYIVNQDDTRVIVTVVNNAATPWSGSITVQARREVAAVREYISGQESPWMPSRNRVHVLVQVPPYDVKVLAVEFQPR